MDKSGISPFSNYCSRVLRKDNPALLLRDLDQPERENLDHDLEVRFSRTRLKFEQLVKAYKWQNCVHFLELAWHLLRFRQNSHTHCGQLQWIFRGTSKSTSLSNEMSKAKCHWKIISWSKSSLLLVLLNVNLNAPLFVFSITDCSAHTFCMQCFKMYKL